MFASTSHLESHRHAKFARYAWTPLPTRSAWFWGLWAVWGLRVMSCRTTVTGLPAIVVAMVAGLLLAGCATGPGSLFSAPPPPGFAAVPPPALQVDMPGTNERLNPVPAVGNSPQVAAVPPSQPAAAAGGPIVRGQSPTAPPTYNAPPPGGWTGGAGAGAPAISNYQPPPGAAPPGSGLPGAGPAATPTVGTGTVPPGWGDIPVPPTMQGPPTNSANIDALLQETQTGRFQFGVGVNSDAGVTGQIVIDERNFDLTRWPNSWDEVINGTAFRGAGQGLRIEAMPGNKVQRYTVSFTEPYLFGYSPVSLNVSGFYFTRYYTDWNEERLGGRLALGYRLSPDLSVSAALRAENVTISNPRVAGVPELDAVVGSNDLYTARFTLIHDTRDIPFFPTEGHYMELAYEQAFGEFSYPRGELDLRKYLLIRERPDGSGRHTLALSGRLGVSGTDTPLFENYFAGGFSTLRGFSFRGASPIDNGVTVGGPLRVLASAEYFFPLTADDMIRGVVFCDAGTVETDLHINWDNFRVAPGFGLRLNIPAMGPAPLALDFAFPVAKADTDHTQTFSFFFGFGR